MIPVAILLQRHGFRKGIASTLVELLLVNRIDGLRTLLGLPALRAIGLSGGITGNQNVRFFRPRCGFTLIELLTVITIIGILAAILLPVISKVRSRTKAAAAKTEMRGIQTSIQHFQNDNGSLFPVSKSTRE